MILPEPPRRGRTGTQWRYETGWADGGWSRNLEGSTDHGTMELDPYGLTRARRKRWRECIYQDTIGQGGLGNYPRL